MHISISHIRCGEDMLFFQWMICLIGLQFNPSAALAAGVDVIFSPSSYIGTGFCFCVWDCD